MSLNSIVFMGTPDFAVPTLKVLIERFPGKVKAVYTRPDSPQGRGLVLTPSPVKKVALLSGIDVFMPTTKEEVRDSLMVLKPDLVVVIAYGMILPKILTDTFFCMNIHGSLLPAYRGASPIHAALLNGDVETGITLIRMNEKMDEGALLFKKAISIQPQDNFQTLHDQLSGLSAEVCLEFLEKDFLTGNIRFDEQDSTRASYCSKITKADLEIKSSDTCAQILGKIRAFSPTPGAFVLFGNKRVKLLEARFENDRLGILKVKPEGKGEMGCKDFCLGSPDFSRCLKEYGLDVS